MLPLGRTHRVPASVLNYCQPRGCSTVTPPCLRRPKTVTFRSYGSCWCGARTPTLATLRGEKVKIHPHSVNAKLHDAARSSGVADKGPTLVCFDDVTRGEAQLYVRECTAVSAASLVLVASSLTVEALPPAGSARTAERSTNACSAGMAALRSARLGAAAGALMMTSSAHTVDSSVGCVPRWLR